MTSRFRRMLLRSGGTALRSVLQRARNAGAYSSRDRRLSQDPELALDVLRSTDLILGRVVPDEVRGPAARLGCAFLVLEDAEADELFVAHLHQIVRVKAAYVLDQRHELVLEPPLVVVEGFLVHAGLEGVAPDTRVHCPLLT